MRRALFIVSLMLALQGGNASAAIQTYAISGLFDDGSIINGSFDYDDGTPSYSNVSVFVGGSGAFTSFTYTASNNSSDQSTLTLEGGLDRVLELAFIPDLPGNLISISGNEFVLGAGLRDVASGTATAVVPAPAAIVLLATALSGLGIGARRARVAATRAEGVLAQI